MSTLFKVLNKTTQVLALRADTAEAVPTQTHTMSDFNVTVAPAIALESTKDGTATPSKDATQTFGSAQQPKSELKQTPLASAPQAKQTDLNYSIDRDNKALHLKIKSMDGEVVREVVFARIDPSLFDIAKLKGVFIDDNS